MTLHVHGLAFDVRMPFIKTEPNSNESPTNVPMASVSPLGHALHCLNARQLSHRQKPPPLPPYECPATNGSFCPATAHTRSNGTHHRQCSTAAIMSVQLPVLHHAAPAQQPTSTTPVTNTGVAPPNNVAAQPQAVAAASASNRGHRGTTKTVEGATIDSGRKGFNKINGSFGSGMTERTDAIRMVTDDDDSDQL